MNKHDDEVIVKWYEAIEAMTPLDRAALWADRNVLPLAVALILFAGVLAWLDDLEQAARFGRWMLGAGGGL